MNFKFKKVLQTLPFAVATAVVASGANLSLPSIDDGKMIGHIETKINEPTTSKKAISTINRYFVLLKDEPVALYQGGISGLSATNIKASNFRNVTASGKLDLNSNSSLAYKAYLHSKQQETLQTIKNRVNGSINVDETFSVALNGFIVSLSSSEAQAIKKLPGVLAVHKEELHQLMTDVGPKHVGAESVWNEVQNYPGSKGEGIVVGVMDTGIAFVYGTSF